MGAPKLKPDHAEGKAVAVKKIRPFPFPAQVIIAEGTPPQIVDIMKLSEIGFLLQTRTKLFFKVGNQVEIQFELPALHKTVKAKAKVVKTYDLLNQTIEGNLEKKYTVEMHFKAIEPKYKDEITRFLKKINPKSNR